MQPAAVVERAHARGVRTLALTDHDELGGLEEARACAGALGIELIDGVEVSVTWRSRTVHVVGLNVDSADPQLIEGLRSNRSGRSGRAERIAARLAMLGIQGALEGAMRYVTNPDLISRAHFARFLVESGRVTGLQAAFDRYLAEGRPAYDPHEWTALSQGVAWIAAAGGIPVLAHPGRYKLDAATRRALLTEFTEAGGRAIEVVTGSHSPEEYGYWGQRAREYGLLASMGSDFHGERESYRDLGELPPLPPGCTPVWAEF